MTEDVVMCGDAGTRNLRGGGATRERIRRELRVCVCASVGEREREMRDVSGSWVYLSVE